jgi:ubiquinone biosynthesis protein UbiJ
MSSSTEKPSTNASPEVAQPESGTNDGLAQELAQIEQEVARRIADNRRFLERFMDLAQELDDDDALEDDGDEEL